MKAAKINKMTQTCPCWIGHVWRRLNKSLVKKVEGLNKGDFKRGSGVPKMTRMIAALKTMRDLGVEVHMTRNKNAWRRILCGECTVNVTN